ncbi:MAG: hypothetical protein KDD49_14505, partial [Bacteroidetes bacterium]|nr:hypothetical protein [Bacteroidota bacterium]
KECRHIYFLLTLFGYKVRKHFKNSLGWWVGFGWLGSFGFAKRWLCVSGQNQMCQMRWQKISFVRWAFFYFFLCRVVVWLGIEVSVRVVVLPLPLTVKYKSSSGFQGDYLSTTTKFIKTQTFDLPLHQLLLLYCVGGSLFFLVVKQTNCQL